MRGQHPNSQKNLKKFKKGQSGNPSGRVKSFNGIKDDLHDKVNSLHPINFEQTYRELIIEAIVNNALDGDWKAIELIEKLGCLEKND